MNLKKRLQNGSCVYGTWCVLPSPEVINVLAKAGLDFVLIDMEHGPMDYALAQRMVMAAEADNCEAIIRVSHNEEAGVLRALDTGASGIIVPHVESPGDRKKAISFMKYPPVGVRGFSPYARAGGYASTSGHTARENSRIVSGIIIEGQAGFAALPAVIDDPELDLVYIGTYDLSSALGIPGEVKNRKVLDVLEKAVKTVRDRGKAAGCLFHDIDELKYFHDIGVQFLAYKVDSSVLYDGFSFLKGIREKNR